MEQSAAPADPSRRPGRRAVLLGLLAVLLVASFATAWLARAWIVERVLTAWLTRAGLDPAQVSVETVEPHSLRLGPGRLGREGKVQFRSIGIDYEPLALLRARLGTIRIDGLVLPAHLDADGFSVPDLGDLFARDEGETAESDRPGDGSDAGLPFDRLILDDARLALSIPTGDVTLSGNAVAEKTASGSIDLQSDLDAGGTIAGLQVHARGRLAGTRSANGDLTGDLRLQDGGVANEVASAASLSGTLTLAADASRLRSLSADITMGDAALPGLGRTSGTLEAEYGETGLSANADATWSGGTFRATAASAGLAAPVTLSVGGTVDAKWLAPRVGAGAETAGEIVLSADGTLPGLEGPPAADGPMSDWRALARWAAVRAEIRPRLTALDLPGLAATGKLGGVGRIETGDGSIRVTFPEPVSAEDVRLDPSLLPLLPEAVRGLAGGPLRVEVATATAVALTPEGDGIAAAGTLAGRLSGNSADVSVSVAGSTVLDDLSRTRIDTGEISVTATDFRLGAGPAPGSLKTSGSVRLRELSGTPGMLAGRLETDLTLNGRPVPSVELRGLDIDLSGPVRLDGATLAFILAESSRMSLREARTAAVRTTTPLVLRPAPGSEAALRYDLAAGSLTGRILLAPATVGIAPAEKGSGAPETRLSLGRTQLDREAGGRTRLALTGIRAELPAQRTRVEDGTARLTVNADLIHELSLEGSVVQAGTPAAVIPLRLQLSAAGNRQASRLEGSLHDEGRRIDLALKGEHSLASGKGRLTFALKQLTFLPTVLQPPALFPAATEFGETDGTASAQGELQWGPGGIGASSATLDVEIRKLVAYGAEFRDVRTNIGFDSLLPPVTRPRQTLTVGGLNVGLPFTDGELGFELNPDGRVAVRLRKLSLFGGSIETRPFSFDPSAPRLDLVLQVDGVRLDEFLSFTEYADLTATGTLQGTIPLVVTPDLITIRNAVLATGAGGGVIHYRPKDAGNAVASATESSQLLMKALEHFNYESIRVEIDEPPETGLTTKLVLRGSSPNVYDNFPMILNVNVSGQLRDVLAQGIRTYQLPGTIGGQMQDSQVQDGQVQNDRKPETPR